MQHNHNMSHLVTKPTKWHVRPAKTQISLGIRPVWSESSLSAWRKLGSLATHWAHSEDSDQTGRMPRLIWVFAGRTCQVVGFVTRRPIWGWRIPYSRLIYLVLLRDILQEQSDLDDSRLILLYKGLKGKASIPTDDLIPRVRHCRNDHPMVYRVPIANADIYKCSFFPQTIRDWNALPDSLMPSTEGAEDGVAKFTSLVRARD